MLVLMYDSILVPTDGSESAEAAVEHAIALAQAVGGSLHTVYVVELHASGPAQVSFAGVADELEEEGEEAIDRVEGAAAEAGVDLVGSVLSGNPDEAIIEYAEENDIDVIVMGTHGRRGLDRAVLGSVTERVVRRSSVPVFTVRSQ